MRTKPYAFIAPRDLKFEARILKGEAHDVVNFPEVVLFWSGWASQWYPSQFTIDEITFNCAEQYMMYKKAQFFGDKGTADKILATKYPKAQKELGRTAGPFNPDWDLPTGSRQVVFEGNMAKFTQNPPLAALLRATEGKLIAEASPYDVIWGIGMAITDKDAQDPTKWKGTNWLGEVLMKVRASLPKS